MGFPKEDPLLTNELLYQLSYTGLVFRSPLHPRCRDEKRDSIRCRTGYFSSKAASFFATATFFSVTYTGSPPRYFGASSPWISGVR